MLEHPARAFPNASAKRPARAYATHARTDARTDADGKGTSGNSPFVSRTGGQSESIPKRGLRARDSDPRTTEQIIEDTFGPPAQRAPVRRTGEREPISPLLRQLVYKRDGWTCQHCGVVPYATLKERRSGALHLDHIVPWSAGGSDRSDNLRTLCGPCNQARSNFVTGREKPSLPIVRICTPCLTLAGFKPAETFVVYCASRYHESWAIPGWSVL